MSWQPSGRLPGGRVEVTGPYLGSSGSHHRLGIQAPRTSISPPSTPPPGPGRTARDGGTESRAPVSLLEAQGTGVPAPLTLHAGTHR